MSIDILASAIMEIYTQPHGIDTLLDALYILLNYECNMSEKIGKITFDTRPAEYACVRLCVRVCV